MTGTSARNSYGIFKSKKAKLLAKKYSLDLCNVNAYTTIGNLVTFIDVKFIIDNLWLDHFMDETEPPLHVTYDEYNDIFYNLQNGWSNLLNYSTA